MHIVLSVRAIRASAGSSRISLAIVRGLATAGARVTVCADRLDEQAVRGAGGEPQFPLGSAGAQQIGRRLLGRGLQRAVRERAVRNSRADLVIGEGDLRRQDVLVVHNIVRREVEELGAAASADNERAAARQERELRENSFDLAVANSELTRRELSRRFGVPEARIVVVHPGVDPAQFALAQRTARRAPTRAALGLGEPDLVVAFVSSGHFVLRGVDVLADTLAHSIAQLPAPERSRLKLLCAGSARNAELLRESLARRGVGVPLVAAARSERVEDYYHAADLLFHPAYFETFGLVIAEAAACGCPVLTSRAVGAAELFQGEGASVLTERPDAAAFAPVLARLLTEPAWRAAVARSQHAALEGRTWDAYGRAFVAALRERGLL